MPRHPLRQSGFTLLEIMVVVMLIGLLTAVVISQGNWVSDDRQLEQENDRLRDTLALLNERSLFSGQLLALRLYPERWQPLVFDVPSSSFQPIDDSVLKPHELPPSLELSWQVDDLGDDTTSLGQVAESLVSDDIMVDTGEGLQEQQENQDASADADEEPFPQVFFFPSGEVSPVTLMLSSRNDIEVEFRTRITALGKITDPDQDESEESAL